MMPVGRRHDPRCRGSADKIRRTWLDSSFCLPQQLGIAVQVKAQQSRASIADARHEQRPSVGRPIHRLQTAQARRHKFRRRLVVQRQNMDCRFRTAEDGNSRPIRREVPSILGIGSGIGIEPHELSATAFHGVESREDKLFMIGNSLSNHTQCRREPCTTKGMDDARRTCQHQLW